MGCDRCTHDKDDHRDDICYGSRFCLCIQYDSPLESVMRRIPKIQEDGLLYSRTSIPLPQPIELHDNWTGKGWEYQRKYGKTQREMVKFLKVNCGLYEDEIRIFLRCKKSSVRGRLSEIKSLQVGV